MTLKPNLSYTKIQTDGRLRKFGIKLTIMSSVAIDQKEIGISWKQMWSLTALYASIVIGWIAYQQYQPKLLVQFKFTDFTFLLVCAEAVILSVTPLIAGKLGDRYRFTRGTRIPIISTGISFAAMVFMAVAFTLLGNPGEARVIPNCLAD